MNGLRDVGIDIEGDAELDRDDRRTINKMLGEQTAYVSNLFARVYGVGISDGVAELKSQQWFARSVLPFYEAGRLSGNENMLVEFGGIDGEESCDVCPKLKGQRHRLVEFHDRGFVPPYGAGLPCSAGGHCKHTLTQVSGKPRGTWV